MKINKSAIVRQTMQVRKAWNKYVALRNKKEAMEKAMGVAIDNWKKEEYKLDDLRAKGGRA